MSIHDMQWIAGTFCLIALVLGWQVHRLRRDLDYERQALDLFCWLIDTRLRQLENRSPEAREAHGRQSSDGTPMGKSQ